MPGIVSWFAEYKKVLRGRPPQVGIPHPHSYMILTFYAITRLLDGQPTTFNGSPRLGHVALIPGSRSPTDSESRPPSLKIKIITSTEDATIYPNGTVVLVAGCHRAPSWGMDVDFVIDATCGFIAPYPCSEPVNGLNHRFILQGTLIKVLPNRGFELAYIGSFHLMPWKMMYVWNPTKGLVTDWRYFLA